MRGSDNQVGSLYVVSQKPVVCVLRNVENRAPQAKKNGQNRLDERYRERRNPPSQVHGAWGGAGTPPMDFSTGPTCKGGIPRDVGGVVQRDADTTLSNEAIWA